MIYYRQSLQKVSMASLFKWLFIKGLSEGDVVPHGALQDPGHLGTEGHRSEKLRRALHLRDLT